MCGAARAACPEVAYPVGIDVGAGTVTATVEVGADGGVTVVALDGPPALADAVRPTLPACDWPGPGRHVEQWVFPEPPVRLAGVVRARGDRAPVRTVLLVGDRTVSTDADGRFEVRNLAPGVVAIRIADPAWRLPAGTEVAVGEGERVDVELWAVPDRARADEIVATYSRDAPIGVVRTIGIEDARAVPGTLGDPLRALTAEPGLTRSPYDAGWLLVRGGDFDEVGLYLDGVKVPLVYHLGGFTSVLHPEMIDSVRFWPGLFPARYGQAISGAVDLVPRAPGDRVEFAGGANLVFAHAFAEVPTPFGGVAIAARRSYLDGVLGLVLDAEAAKIAPRFWDLSAQVRVGAARFLALTFRDAIDAPSFSGDGTLTIEQAATQLQAVIPVPAGRGELSVRPWLAWTERTVTGDVTPQQVDELYPGIRVEGERPVGPTDGGFGAGTVSGGAEVQRRRFQIDRDAIVRAAGVWNLDPYAGIAVGDSVRLWSEARLTAVLIEGEPTQPVRVGLSPRGGVRFTPNRALSVRAEFGRLQELPAPTLLLAVAEGSYLGLERGDQASLGATVTVGPVTVDADAWTRRTTQLAQLELDGSIGEGDGKAHGFESRARFRRDGFEGSVLYQFTRTFLREDPGDAFLPSAFDVPHRVELFAAQRLPRAWLASARFRWTAGYPRVVEGDAYVPVEAYDLLLQRTVGLGLPDDADRLAPFHALDLRIGRRFVLRGWDLEVALDVQNVYSRRVVEPVIAGFGESGPTYGFGLPVLPVFSIDGHVWPGWRGWTRRADRN